MKRIIALCLRNDRIAPRYDQPDNLCLVELDGREVVATSFIPVDNMKPGDICRLMASHHVGLVVCGGVREECQRTLNSAGIRFIENVIGGREPALAAIIDERLAPGMILD